MYIVLLDMPDSSSPPTTKPSIISRDTERYFCHWGECNVQTGQLAELIQHIRHVHVGSGKVCKTRIIGITSTRVVVQETHGLNDMQCITFCIQQQAYYCKWAGCSRQDKPFVKRHKMHNHIRTHTGEKPFACKIQGKGWCFDM